MIFNPQIGFGRAISQSSMQKYFSWCWHAGNAQECHLQLQSLFFQWVCNSFITTFITMLFSWLKSLFFRKLLLIRPKLKLCDDGNYRESRWFTAWTKV
jgi:hypothetical protein